MQISLIHQTYFKFKVCQPLICSDIRSGPALVIMPPRRTAAQKEALAKGREKAHTTVEDYESAFHKAKNDFDAASGRLNVLEADLHDARLECDNLRQKLALSSDKCKGLSKELKLQKEKSKKVYQELRIERQARQRTQKRRDILEDQIRLLKDAGLEKSKDMTNLTRHADLAVDNLIGAEKANAGLRTELSKTLEHYKLDMGAARTKLIIAGKKLRDARASVVKLKKSIARFAVSKEKAISKAAEALLKKKSVHNLLEKGKYTEETRNLIRLLVKAGCGRDYITEVITAVLKTAGITVVGSISRRTVSRVILEGYYAACIQIGYEMQEAEGMYCSQYKNSCKMFINSFRPYNKC